MSDRVLSLVAEQAGSGGSDVVQAFARAYLRRPAGVRAADDRTPEELAAEVLGAYRLTASRGSAFAAVRAFTPVLEEHGYVATGSVLETSCQDLPFLVDSVTAELRARGLEPQRVAHPIIGLRHAADGSIAEVVHPRDAPERESVMHFELDRRLDPEELAALEDGVREVLGTVQLVVGDGGAMMDVARDLARDTDDEDVAEFLRWLLDDHFVFLGARTPAGGLGLLRDEAFPAPQRPAETTETLVITKTPIPSPVHRRERMDHVAVGDGAHLLGLFTTRAYNEPASKTPLLRPKLRHILEAEDLFEGSHDFKAAVTLFDAIPKDELFAAPAEDLRRAIVTLMALRGEDVRLLARRHPDGKGASIVAALPRSRSTARLRKKLRLAVGHAYGTSEVDLAEVFGEDDRVQLHIGVFRPDGLPEVEPRELEERLRDLARTWEDGVREELAARHRAERGGVLAARWVDRLPERYRTIHGAAAAAEDVHCLEELATGAEDVVVGLQDEPAADGTPRTRVTFYKRGAKIELSEATPMLEHLGLRVIEELPTRLSGAGEMWLQGFAVLGPGDRPLDLEACGDRVSDALTAIWRGAGESDSLNRLVVLAGLRWQQVEVLRAYRRYRQRIGSRYTESFQNDVIADNPITTAKMIRLFELRFDPAAPRDPAVEDALRDEILAELDAVELLDHDRILRNQLGLILATVRTNVYRPDRDAMAFKLRSGDVPAIPLPAPLFEIYVYAPDMEGIHLRGGKIARGGLRWSDRMDYRTEVYGLLRAQMTKNAVIVPAGAKGGFFLKRRPDDPAELKAEVERQYIRYIDALLDVTDNLIDGKVDRPASVVVHDEDDTYLVVAADKGTATFSDTANKVAVRRGFWLGDAFASGGSNGYDHKALGITARGAWESVKRHFRELDVDPEADIITAVGIGDMSGDVFGNGMLLSETLKLVAAYDHRHVFLDPDPDPASSWAERKRLFDLPGSSWADYDSALISAGGGVFPRAAKSIPLTDEVRAALGIEDAALPPAEVIRAILRAPVDLLWNGGIGTVVKASHESDADALDRSSDAIRVDACDLRCRVVGEGGNLGLTQRGRIELARGGTRVNADWIDNSAGVDCSDHEVNLKILLDLAVREGELDVEGRNQLLQEVTEDITQHVLHDSFLQAQIIAQELQVSAARMFAYEDLMEQLEAEGLLDRASEALPAGDEMAERRSSSRGLERPELAVLLAYAKRSVTDALLAGELPDDPFFEADVRDYFPARVVERFGHLLGRHPLRRELVATLVANDVVDALGPTFVSGLSAELGASPAAVVRAYRLAREATDARNRWEQVEKLDRELDHETYWELMHGVDALVEDAARFYLIHAPAGELGECAAAARAGFAELEAVLGSLRSDEWRAAHEATGGELTARGVPAEIALRHAFQPALVHAPDVIAIARSCSRTVEDAARAAFGIGEGLRLEWLEAEIDALPAQGRLARWALMAVRDDVLAARRILAERALALSPGADPQLAVETFLQSREEERRRLSAFTRALALEGTTDLAGLSLAARHLVALGE